MWHLFDLGVDAGEDGGHNIDEWWRVRWPSSGMRVTVPLTRRGLTAWRRDVGR
jgi:hypothetical protein